METYKLPLEYPAQAWTVDESTPFSLATDGYDCRGATVAICRFEPGGGATFTTYDIIPEGYRDESGWQPLTLEAYTEASNNPAEVTLDIRGFSRIGFRVDNSAGTSLAGNKYVALG